MTSKPETVFLLQRAEEEAILAIRTERQAAQAHYELSLRYSARALRALAEDEGLVAARDNSRNFWS